MNDMATYIDCAVAAAGRLNRCDIEGVNRQLRAVQPGGYLYPIDLVTARGEPGGVPKLVLRVL